MMKLNIEILKQKAEDILPLNEYGFQTTTQVENLYIVYKSQQYKIKLFIDNVNYDQDFYHIFYGRHHALDNELEMNWQGEQCRCWYGYSETQDILKYLDGLSPEEAYKTTWEYLKKDWKPYGVFNKNNQELFKYSEDWQLDMNWLFKVHVKIWDMYGDRFFRIFDMNYPDVWEDYIVFLTEMYKSDETRYKNKGLIPLKKYC